MWSNEITVSLIIIGDAGIGKSEFTKALREGAAYSFKKTTSSTTLGVDFIVLHYDWPDNVHVRVHLWDTAGQERFRAITKQYVRNRDAVIFAFQMGCPVPGIMPVSLDNLLNWYTDVIKEVTARDHITAAVLCTKADLAKDKDPAYFDSVLNYARSEICPRILSRPHDLHTMGISSAATNQGIHEFFNQLVRVTVERKLQERKALAPPGTPSSRLQPSGQTFIRKQNYGGSEGDCCH